MRESNLNVKARVRVRVRTRVRVQELDFGLGLRIRVRVITFPCPDSSIASKRLIKSPPIRVRVRVSCIEETDKVASN